MIAAVTLDRRAFLRLGAAAGGGLLLVLGAPGCRPVGETPAASGPPFTPNAFLRLDSDGTVTLLVGRQEMGQGVRSGLPRIVAAEMDADWSRVRLEQADLDDQVRRPVRRRQQQHAARLRASAAGRRRGALAAAAGCRAALAGSGRRAAHAGVGGSMHAGGRSAGYGELAAAARTLAETQPALLDEAAKAPLRDLRDAAAARQAHAPARRARHRDRPASASASTHASPACASPS